MSNFLRPNRNALAWLLSSVTNSPTAGVGERALPAAVGEGVDGIFLRSPGHPTGYAPGMMPEAWSEAEVAPGGAHTALIEDPRGRDGPSVASQVPGGGTR
jgi:hypothetical protein